MRRFLILAILTLAAAMLPLSAQAKTVTIQMLEFKFVPPSPPVTVGDTIVFRNTGATVHNAVAKDGSFKTAPTVNAGQQESVSITKAGSIEYVCTLHETVGMKATLTVAAAPGDPGNPGSQQDQSGNPAGGAAAPTPSAPAEGADSESEAATEASPAAEEDEVETAPTPVAAPAPPTQKYFPWIALLMLLGLAPMVGLAYRRLMKSGGPPAAPPPAESAG